MGAKKIAVFCALAALFGCASETEKKPEAPPPVVVKEPIPEVLPPPTIAPAKDLPPLSGLNVPTAVLAPEAASAVSSAALAPGAATAPVSTAAPAQPVAVVPPVSTVPRGFAVWIDGAGLDAIAALGFLEELEHAGYKPVKIVGSGFGCWVAVSWALENSGNRAEWQAYKWTSWDHLPGSGLIGKLTGGGARKDFEEDVGRMLTAKRFEELALPADCPVIAGRESSKLSSAREYGLPSALWYQFNTPALGVDSFDDNVFSGLAAGAPDADELVAMGKDIPRDKINFAGWIILRTRNSLDRGGKKSWAEVLARRGDEHAPGSGKLPDGGAWTTIDLSGGADRPAADVQKFDKRREWLLQGRQIGINVLQKGETKNFFE